MLCFRRCDQDIDPGLIEMLVEPVGIELKGNARLGERLCGHTCDGCTFIVESPAPSISRTAYAVA